MVSSGLGVGYGSRAWGLVRVSGLGSGPCPWFGVGSRVGALGSGPELRVQGQGSGVEDPELDPRDGAWGWGSGSMVRV